MSIHRAEMVPGYPILVIEHPCATARVALQGAHLLEWTPAGQAPVLYLSPTAIYAPGKPIRGGVPVCWPWFGAAADPRLPAHGFARLHPWELASEAEHPTGVTLRFRLTSSPATLALWPHAFQLELTMEIGAELRLTLTTTNLDPAPVIISEALHTYLTVGDSSQISISGLDDCAYLDTVGARTQRTQSGDLTIHQEVDRLYHSAHPVVLVDPALQRRLTVQNIGSGTTVVWNPWIAKSLTLSDLPPTAYTGFVCIETARAGSDCVTLAPGATHHLSAHWKLENA